MMQSVDKLNSYLDMVKSIHHCDVPANFWNFQTGDKQALVHGISEKANLEREWSGLLEELRQDEVFRVRDMSGAGVRHSFTGMASYGSSSFGMVFAISFPFRSYGFYYCKVIEAAEPNRYRQEFSYRVFDREMENSCKKIELTIQMHFPGFELFDNTYADLKIHKAVIDGVHFPEIDFWHAILSTYEEGLV